MADKNAAGIEGLRGGHPGAHGDRPGRGHPSRSVAGLIYFKDPVGINRLCTFTDENGNTALEVFNSNRSGVDVIAESSTRASSATSR